MYTTLSLVAPNLKAVLVCGYRYTSMCVRIFFITSHLRVYAMLKIYVMIYMCTVVDFIVTK